METGDSTRGRLAEVDPVDALAAIFAGASAGKAGAFWGRTALHKALFLAELDLGRAREPMPGFRFHRFTYGPYSDDVALAIERLAESGWLEEQSPRPTEAALRALAPFFEVLRQDPKTGAAWLRIDGRAREIASTYSNKQALCEAVYDMKLAASDWMGGYETTIRDIPLQAEILEPDAILSEVLPEALRRGIAFALSGRPEDLLESAVCDVDAETFTSWLERGGGPPWLEPSS